MQTLVIESRNDPDLALRVGYVAPTRGGAALDSGGYQHVLRDNTAAEHCAGAERLLDIDCDTRVPPPRR